MQSFPLGHDLARGVKQERFFDLLQEKKFLRRTIQPSTHSTKYTDEEAKGHFSQEDQACVPHINLGLWSNFILLQASWRSFLANAETECQHNFLLGIVLQTLVRKILSLPDFPHHKIFLQTWLPLISLSLTWWRLWVEAILIALL